jgi:V-type H+-transporting ATPase subunit a
MGTWWRSEDMSLVSLILSEEAAPACLRELGAMGCIQFIDLNPEQTPFQRRYVMFIKRCDEIERKIRYIAEEMKTLKVSTQSSSSVDQFIEKFSDGEASKLEGLESTLDAYEQQLLELNKFSKKLSDEFTHKVKVHVAFIISLLKPPLIPLGGIPSFAHQSEEISSRPR